MLPFQIWWIFVYAVCSVHCAILPLKKEKCFLRTVPTSAFWKIPNQRKKNFYAKYIFMLQIITSYFKTFLAHELFFINKSIYLTNKNYVWMCD